MTDQNKTQKEESMSKEPKEPKELEIDLKEVPAENTADSDWCEIKVYKEQVQNREVIELKSIKDGTCIFKGGIIIAIQGPRGIQPIRHEFKFPEGWTREQAFSDFDEQAEKAVEEWQEEQRKQAAAQRSQIAVPPRKAGPQILGPGGKPMNRQARRKRR